MSPISSFPILLCIQFWCFTKSETQKTDQKCPPSVPANKTVLQEINFQELDFQNEVYQKYSSHHKYFKEQSQQVI